MTLIELVVVIVIIGIIIATTVYFLYPVTQAVDLAGRAELTDSADNALQRIGRDVRLALPNSVRVTTSGSVQYLEFLPIRVAGRYRAAGGGIAGGTNCPNTGAGVPASDQLSFDVVDTCFKTIGTIGTTAEVAAITTSDWLALNNYGANFSGQDAYATTGTLNRRQLSALPDTSEATRIRFSFTSSTALASALHDSAGKRFFIVVGNSTTTLPEAVSYICTPNPANPTLGTLVRRWGYTMTPAQPTTFTDGNPPATIAANVSACTFDYSPSVAPQIGLLAMTLTLSKTLSGNVETVSLYHTVHVNNVP